MRKLLLLVLCALYFAASPVLTAGKQKLINGIDANFPPFAFIDKSGQPSGFDVEAMNWIAKDFGMEVTHMPIEWDGIVTSLVTKKINIIASSITINKERARQVTFTEPYWKLSVLLCPIFTDEIK